MLDWPHPPAHHPEVHRAPVRRRRRRDSTWTSCCTTAALASTWAASAAVGDEVTIAGPPGAKAFPHHYDHYLFAVDNTALPAVGRWLEQSPADVRPTSWSRSTTSAEAGLPAGGARRVTVTWLRARGRRLERSPRRCSRCALPAGRSFLFAAGEATDIKPLRAWSRERLDALITGYWKRGIAGLEDSTCPAGGSSCSCPPRCSSSRRARAWRWAPAPSRSAEVWRALHRLRRHHRPSRRTRHPAAPHDPRRLRRRRPRRGRGADPVADPQPAAEPGILGVTAGAGFAINLGVLRAWPAAGRAARARRGRRPPSPRSWSTPSGGPHRCDWSSRGSR